MVSMAAREERGVVASSVVTDSRRAVGEQSVHTSSPAHCNLGRPAGRSRSWS